MFVRDGEWVDEEPRERPEKKKKKRHVTDAMIAANRANSKFSTGPVTDSGKATSRFNSVQHGLAGREIFFLPGENSGIFWQTVDRWCRQRGAKTEDERACIIQAVYSLWIQARAINAQAGAVAEAINKINDSFTDQRAAEALAVSENLTSKPEETVCALVNSVYGCEILIEEFQALAQRLQTHTSFEVSQRQHALRVGGNRPKDLFVSKMVMEFNRSYFGGIRGTGGFTAAQVANTLMYDRPDEMSEEEFERRLEQMVANLPTIEEGHSKLQEYVNRWINQLSDRRELMELRQERDKKLAIEKAQAEVHAEGQTRARYIDQSIRRFQGSMRMAMALKAERRKFGEEDDDGPAAGMHRRADASHAADPAPESASDPVEIVPESAVNPFVEVQKPSEAVTTQVVTPSSR